MGGVAGDGELAHLLLHPSFESEREYEVEVRGRISREALRRLAAGVLLRLGREVQADLLALGFRHASPFGLQGTRAPANS